MPQQEPSIARQEEKTGKSERLEARLTAEQKELLQWAADLEGRTLSDYVVSHAQQAALQTIADQNLIRLSRADSAAFVAALLDPPALPADAPLVRAIARYKQSQERG